MIINKEVVERRSEERVAVSLPLNSEKIDQVTRDISASGVYFEAAEHYSIGDQMDFVVEFVNRGGNLFLKCRGEVVRVENHKKKVGVAVKILHSVMASSK
ncbi:MAG: PilZ domain-containing protein [Gallionella sp.]